jgi:hypothetical protein
MEAITDTPLNAYQTKRLAEHSEAMERAFKILNGGRALGLEMLDLDVLGGFRAWDNPENPSGSVVAYAHQDARISLDATSENRDVLSACPIFTVLRRDEDHNPTERLLVTMGMDLDTGRELVYLLDRTEAEVLSPADTAIELTEADVEPLERVSRMFGSFQVPAEYIKESEQGGTLPFLEGILGKRFPGYGHGIERDGTLYVVANEVGEVKAIRPDGTILPIGYSLDDPDPDCDGEREEIIRPRLENLRE